MPGPYPGNQARLMRGPQDQWTGTQLGGLWQNPRCLSKKTDVLLAVVGPKELRRTD
jgi:hypothetical protein